MRIVTPGTVVDPAMLAAKRNNYLAAAVLGRDAGAGLRGRHDRRVGLHPIHRARAGARAQQELARVQPAEVLVEAHRAARAAASARVAAVMGEKQVTKDGSNGPTRHWTRGRATRDLTARWRLQGGRRETVVTAFEPRDFREEVARERLLAHFGVATLEAFGCERLPLAVRAAGAVIAYLRETQRGALARFTALETYSTSGSWCSTRTRGATWKCSKAGAAAP